MQRKKGGFENEKKNLKKMVKLLIVDCEMTGLDVEVDALVQIGAVCGRDTFTTYINARVPMTPDAARVTGITDEQLENAPCVKDGLEAFWGWVRSLGKDLIMVAHSGFASDFPFLWRAMEDCNIPVETAAPNVMWVFDTLLWARCNVSRAQVRRATGSSSVGLLNLYVAVVGHPPEKSHDALQDCLTLKTIIDGLPIEIVPRTSHKTSLQYQMFKNNRAQKSCAV
jgi:DNA polymerase III epsilon subunit-like protein